MNDGNEEATSFVAAGAVEQRELYNAWVSVGFTPEQALELVKAVLIAVLKKEGLC